jgi:hypothetical protein
LGEDGAVPGKLMGTSCAAANLFLGWGARNHLG